MARVSVSALSLIGAALSYLLYAYGPHVYRTGTVLGVLRWRPASTTGPDEIVVISDTVHCEDVHYYAPGEVLFSACEDNPETRLGWFPALANLDDPGLGRRGRGSIHIIDVSVSALLPLTVRQSVD